VKVESIGYILHGSIRVYLSKMNEGEKEEMVEVTQVGTGELIWEIGAILEQDSSGRIVAGGEGCQLLAIPKDILLNEVKRKDFQLRMFDSMMQLMWNRILNHERKQTEQWSNSLYEKLLFS